MLLRCRTCLTDLKTNVEDEFFSVNYHLETTENLASWIEELTSLHLSATNQDYPQLVCEDCYMKFKDFHDFRRVVRQAAEELDTMYSKNQLIQLKSDLDELPTELQCVEPTIKIEEELEVFETGSSTVFNENAIPTDDLLFDLQQEKTNNEINESETEENSFPVKLNKSHVTANLHNLRNSLILNTAAVDEVAEFALKSEMLENTSAIENTDNNFENFRHEFSSCRKFQKHPKRKLLKNMSSKNTKLRKNVAKQRSNIYNTNTKSQCYVCQKFFATNDCLKQHFSTIHKGLRPFECQICHLRFAERNSLRKHERVHTGEKPFACDICGRHFTHQANMQKHRKIHKNKHMDEELVSFNTVWENSQNDGRTDEAKEKVVSSEFEFIITNMDGPNFQDNKKEMDAIRESAYPSDDKILRNESQAVCLDSSENSNDSIQDEKTQKSATKYKCSECDLEFPHILSLNAHRRQSNHAANAHNMKNSHPCTICKSIFTRKFNLKRHMLWIHSGARPFDCKLCELRFTKKEHLITHERIHTGEKPFTCDICDRCFVHLKTMEKHRERCKTVGRK